MVKPLKMKVDMDDLVEHLTESHVESCGGYPYDSEWVGELFIVAAFDDAKDRNRTELSIFTESAMRACVEKVNIEMENGMWNNVEEAFWENLPDQATDADLGYSPTDGRGSM